MSHTNTKVWFLLLAALVLAGCMNTAQMHQREWNEAHAMVDAVEKAGGKIESYLYRRELHDLIDEANRSEFHEKLAAFFARHLSAIESL